MENEKFVRAVTQDNMVTEKVDIIKNCLLGDYQNEGDYIIASQIVNELIKLKKVRKSSYDNSMFCSGNLLGFGEIMFEITIEKPDNNNGLATAKLYLLEDVDKVNGYLQNTIKTLIAEFTSNMNNFIEESYKKFNVTNESDEDDEEGKEVKDLEAISLDDSYILAKKAYLLLVDKLTSEKVLDAYGKYFTARLTLLSKTDNEFSHAVLESFNNKYNLIEAMFLKDKNYMNLNELLDSCFEEISGTKEIYIAQEQKYNEQMANALNDFTQSVNSLNERVEKRALDMLEKPDHDKMEQMIESVKNRENSIENLNDTDSTGDDAVQLEKVDAEDIDKSIITTQNFEDIPNPLLLEEEEQEEEESKSDEKESPEEPENKQENSIIQAMKDLSKNQPKDLEKEEIQEEKAEQQIPNLEDKKEETPSTSSEFNNVKSQLAALQAKFKTLNEAQVKTESQTLSENVNQTKSASVKANEDTNINLESFIQSNAMQKDGTSSNEGTKTNSQSTTLGSIFAYYANKNMFAENKAKTSTSSEYDSSIRDDSYFSKDNAKSFDNEIEYSSASSSASENVYSQNAYDSIGKVETKDDHVVESRGQDIVSSTPFYNENIFVPTNDEQDAEQTTYQGIENLDKDNNSFLNPQSVDSQSNPESASKKEGNPQYDEKGKENTNYSGRDIYGITERLGSVIQDSERSQ